MCMHSLATARSQDLAVSKNKSFTSECPIRCWRMQV